ncbi:MAG: ABC transporter ATP-binding protein [Caldilineaceae bacterium]|nr:ABC transporter ATP-binding protein [Caldilineaceae bacterium]
MRTMSPLAFFWRYLQPHRLQLGGLWFALLATIAIQLINPQIIGRFLDAAAVNSPLVVLLRAAGLFLLMALLEQIIGLVTTYLSTDVAWLATNRLREDLVRHCLRLDRTFHQAHPPGELIERIDGDVQTLGNFFSQLGLNLLNNLLLMAGVLLLLWWEAWQLGLAVTVIAGCGLFAVDWLRRQAVPYWQRAYQAMADLYGYLEERLHGTEDIAANGATAYTLHGLYAHLQRAYVIALQTQRYNVGGLMTPILVFGLAYMALFLLGDRLYQQGMRIGTVYLVFHYLGLLSGPLWQIVNEIRDLQTAGASIARVQDLLQTPTSRQTQGTAQLTDGPLRVAFDGIAVRYAGAQQLALDGISFHLAPGATLGLLGRTGSGKTTLTRLLLGLAEPTRGSIYLGDPPVALTDLSLTELRRHIGMVTQDVQLFQATIRDNLTFFDPTIRDETLLAMAKALGLAEWLTTLPAGLDTQVGVGGEGLSAGQAQLVAFLRIGLQNPGLVILDEPTSRLDPVTERLLDRAIGRLLAGRTGIIIAHRLATIQRVDQIMILAAGRVVESGPRQALLAQVDSHFAGLLAQSDP